MQRKSVHHIVDDSSHGSIWGTSKVNALSVWTINDQKKLLSLNDLYLRSLDYHCNVHTKETTLFVANQLARSTDEMNDTVESTAILANVITFSADKSKRLLQSMHYLQLRGFCRNVVKLAGVTEEASIPAPSSPQQTNQTLPKDNYWFHLRDLKGLDVLASHVKMHDLIYTGFHDLRAYPTMISTGNEIMITHVICSLEDLEFRMHKLFIYVRDNVIITFEVELFPDLEDILEDQSADVLESMLDDMKLNRSNSVTSKGEAVVNPLAPVDVENPEEKNHSTPPAATTIPHLSKVTDRLMQRFFQHATRLKQKVLEMGVMYLVYEICMQSLAFYDGSIEYVASSLAYFNRIVVLNLLHGERMAIMKKIHLLSAGISLLKKLMEDCAENFGKLAQLESGTTAYGITPNNNHHHHLPHDHLHPPSSPHLSNMKRFSSGNHSSRLITFLNDTHTLYLTDIHDSYLFKCKAIQKQADEIIRLETELDARIQLRATNASTMLSLIATTFLPLTFFSGVFGMNFTVDGGYTMELLNATYGVDVFIALCILSAFFSIVFFSYQGWLEFGIFAKLYRAMNSSEKIDDIKNGESYDEEAAQKAEEEENRRRAESMQMRNSYALFSGRATSGSTASTGGWDQGISLFGIQNLYPAQGNNTSNTSSSNVREEVIEFYRQHNPSKLSSVDSILSNYRGKERELLRKLHKQYDIPL